MQNMPHWPKEQRWVFRRQNQRTMTETNGNKRWQHERTICQMELPFAATRRDARDADVFVVTAVE